MPISCKKGSPLEQTTHDNRLRRLKELLLGSELELLEKLEQELRALRLTCDDEDAVAARIAPVFERVFAKRLKHADNQIVPLLAEHIAEIVRQASQHDLPNLSRALQDVVAPAISKEISRNKESMIDALYPIMGGMISKYVTQAIKEMMEKINRKIEEGLSAQRIKRKLKAKLTGVSETELLLEESADARILALFVIHKPTGLLIASAQVEENLIDDAHMVAAMASAVKDFLNDSLDLRKEIKEEIQILSYGDATLYIESAGSVYLIAFLDKEPDYALRGDINDFFARIVKRFAHFFQHFEGNETAQEAQTLKAQLQEFLHDYSGIPTSSDNARTSRTAWYIFGAAVVFVAGWLLYRSWQDYTLHTLERMAQRHGIVNPSLREYNATHLILEGVTHTPQNISRIIHHIKNQTGCDVISAVAHKATYTPTPAPLVPAWKQPLQTLQQQIKDLQETLRQTDKKWQKRFVAMQASWRDKLDAAQHTLQKQQTLLHRYEADLAHIKQTLALPRQIRRTLNEAMRTSPYYRAKEGKLDFASLKPFHADAADMRPQARRIFLEHTQRYLRALCPYAPYIETITIQAFSDSSGNSAQNLRLTQARAAHAKKLLVELGSCFAADRFVDRGFGAQHPVMVNGQEDRAASRRIEVGYSLNTDALLEKLQKVEKTPSD